MGGSSKQTQSTSQTTTPWSGATPALNSILGGISSINPGLSGLSSGALAGIEANAANGNPYASGIGNVASTLLQGGGPDRSGYATGAYQSPQNNLADTASGKFLDPNSNPYTSGILDAITNSARNSVAGMYAGSGRDPAGAGSFGYTLGKGVSEAAAPALAGIYGQERQNQLNAANTLYGAGNTTGGLLSGLDQTRLANQGAGIQAATAALSARNQPFNSTLEAEAQRSGIPLGILSQLAGITTPMAQAFGTTNGNSMTTGQMSGAQQFATILQGIGALSGFGKGGGGGGGSTPVPD